MMMMMLMKMCRGETEWRCLSLYVPTSSNFAKTLKQWSILSTVGKTLQTHLESWVVIYGMKGTAYIKHHQTVCNSCSCFVGCSTWTLHGWVVLRHLTMLPALHQGLWQLLLCSKQRSNSKVNKIKSTWEFLSLSQKLQSKLQSFFVKGIPTDAKNSEPPTLTT